MPKKIDEPCPICGGPCSTWAISDDPNEDMVLCWQGDYKVRGLANHKRLSGIVQRLKKALEMTGEEGRLYADLAIFRTAAAEEKFIQAQARTAGAVGELLAFSAGERDRQRKC